MCIHFFPNGRVSDSVRYVFDKPEGYWLFYTPEGELRHATYFYSGLQFGPEIWYRKDEVLKTFRFLNFEREPIVECTYNTHGNLDSIEKIDLKPVLTEKVSSRAPVVEFFTYLPQIPLTNVFYSIGVADKNHVKQKLYDIKGANFIIDTLLPPPAAGYHFYLRCDVKNDAGELVHSRMTEMVKSDETQK
jgi:hypothetical protein